MLPTETFRAASASTDDYAKHLQDSRASKLRKWTNSAAPTGANQGIASSFAEFGGPAIRRRPPIPDFSHGFDDTEVLNMRDDAAGDIGARPDTAKGREIEWVDWLEEYKQRKEAKILEDKAAAMTDGIIQGINELHLGSETSTTAVEDTSTPQTASMREAGQLTAHGELSGWTFI